MRSRPSKKQAALTKDDINVTQIVEEEIVEDLDLKISKLFKSQPLLAIDFHAFKDEYGLPNEGINPHIIKSKDVQEVELKEVFGPARGRSGYSFVECYNFQIVERIKEIYIIVYGNNEVPRSKLIRKEFARDIVVEIVKGQKVSWVGFGHEINTNQQSKWLSWIEKCIEKKENLVGKTIAQVKTKLGMEDVMKGEKKVKRKFDLGSSGWNVGKVSHSIDKNKIEVVDLMNIVGLELESKSSKVGMVKLNKKKEELASKVNNMQVVLASMQSTIVETKI